MHWLVPTGRSWQSIASSYVELLARDLLPRSGRNRPRVPVVRAADRQGTHGRGRSIFGIVTGCIGTLFGLLALLG